MQIPVNLLRDCGEYRGGCSALQMWVTLYWRDGASLNQLEAQLHWSRPRVIRALKWLRELEWLDGYETRFKDHRSIVECEHGWVQRVADTCTPSTLKLIVVVMDKTHGWGKVRDQIAYSQFAKFAKCARSTVYHCIRRMRLNRVVEREVQTTSPMPTYQLHKTYYPPSANWYRVARAVQRGREFLGGNGNRVHNYKDHHIIIKKRQKRRGWRGAPIQFDQDGYMSEEDVKIWGSGLQSINKFTRR